MIMMNRTLIFLTLISVIFFVSCQPSKEKMEKEIASLEAKLFDAESGFSRTGADNLIQEYQDFAAAYPADSLSPIYLFKAASIIMNLQDGPKAIALFDEIRSTYPEYEKAPLCLFFTGYVQENVLGDIDQARETYTLFIETYPNHDFADDAEASISNLGKTPEQMIQQFETDQQPSDEGK